MADTGRTVQLEETYTADWFRRRFHYRSAYHRFAAAILDVFDPAGVADVGCGMGWTVEYLRARLPVIGVEGSRGAVEQMRPEVRRLVHLHDLEREEPIPQLADYEFCLSIEVAEHIGPRPEVVQRFLDWCTQGRRLLLTAAPPGQRGEHHVNCRPPEFWQRLLALRGWEYREEETQQWKEAARRRTGGCPWVVRNAMFFEKRREDSHE